MVTLGTGLTALFLLVRCTVEEPDYSLLNIGENAGSGGSGSGGDGGSGADGTGGTSAGQGGLGGLGGLGGQGGTPVEPIPCDPVITDAGVTDAGVTDGGLTDAGLNGATDAGPSDPCECVDGFIRAVDADGDGAGTRECIVAPGLDCDDGDNAVTHNSCNGCSVLPNAVGEDCLDCGAYVCGGPDTLVCASKPNPTVVDPDCQCQDAVIVARDTDQDGQGTRECEANPGSDCNDGNGAFVTDVCGGCNESPPGTLGALCNACGVWSCNGTAMVCVGASAPRCSNTTTRETCLPSGFTSNENCTHGCYGGACAPCDVGTYRCTFYTTGDAISACVLGSSTGTVNWESAGSCSSNTPTLRCNPANGTCTGSLLLPRDQTFDVVPLLERGGLRWHDVLNTASDADYG